MENSILGNSEILCSGPAALVEDFVNRFEQVNHVRPKKVLLPHWLFQLWSEQTKNQGSKLFVEIVIESGDVKIPTAE
ncbi:hypothetical protein [Pseudoalteromonas luteoviolacea]|uniref:Uncharacterized protein n=1 Tax=Pseudoalteromonas luteoviolacea S4060-1 TaxID=1365257 RepID=A0A167KV95_9GAMM|nr:hypothetical protein [Pseudoalteromonas luteoviolacea]KZN63337.1 hypothetical protein N478_03545 [Pseudoalteromonas luteoviolacea S4060-1]